MTTKIAVSLPDEQVAAARTAVAEGRAPSVSAYVSEALARRSAEEELLELLDQDEAAGPPATEEHRVWARQALSSVAVPPAGRPKAGAATGRHGKTTAAASGRHGKTIAGARKKHPGSHG